MGPPPEKGPYTATREDAQELLKALQEDPSQWPADLGPCPTTEEEAATIMEWFAWLRGMEEQWAAELQSLQQQQQPWQSAQQWGYSQQQSQQQQQSSQQTAAAPGGGANTYSYANPAIDHLRTTWLNDWASQPSSSHQPL